MTAFWVIATLLFLLLLWLLMQPKQGTKASNAPKPRPAIPDALPSGKEREQAAEMDVVDVISQEGVRLPASSRSLESEVQQLLDSGQRIRAIKRVRAVKHWGLREAKDYVDALSRQEPPPIQRSSAPSRSLKAEVQQLLASGQRIAAIKRVRTVKHWGLREAKDYVDALSQQEPPPIPPSQSIVEPTPELRQEVLRLLTSHRKLHAVKLVRKQMGWHLYEAKNYVDAIQQEEFQGRDNAGSTDWSDPALREEVKDLLAADRTFDAVERVRHVTGWELRQALEYVVTVQQSRY